MYATLFFSSFLLAFSGAMMPGPLLTATIGAAATRGPVAGPLFIAGHGLLELLLVVFLILGLAPLLTSTPAFVLISLAGAVIMLFMAYSMFRSLPGLSLAAEIKPPSYTSLLTAGALLSVSNPYWTVWWGTIGLGFLLRAQRAGIPGVISFFAGHILGDLVWYAAVSVAVWHGRALLTDRIYRGLIAFCGVLIAAFGLYFLASGLEPVLEVLYI
jgi:threonine/homoserine/homoserine lactone efflux protein